MKPIQPTTPQTFTADDRRRAADEFKKYRKMFDDTHPMECRFGEILNKKLGEVKNGNNG